MHIKTEEFPDALPELHCHVRSDKDAFIFPDRLTERMKEMGMEGIAVTDHGVLSSIEDYRHALSGAGLKIIPGVELYVIDKNPGRTHAIVLAMDDEGYHGISKIVTESNKSLISGYPTITEEKLLEMGKQYKGHIIFMTACMQGVISRIFLRNKDITKLIAKTHKKQEKFTDPSSEKYLAAEKKYEEAEDTVAELKTLRDETKRTAEQKFSQREKKIKKLEGNEKEEAELLLAADKEAKEEAEKKLPEIKKQLMAAQKKLTEARKAFSLLHASADKWNELEKEACDLKAGESDDAAMEKEAEETLMRYANAFGKENVYAEIQYHGIDDEKICFPKAAGVAEKCGIKLTATNDVHMLTNSGEDLIRRSLIRSMRFQTEFLRPSESDKELYLKTTEERYDILSEIFDDDTIIKAFKGTMEAYSRCNVKFETAEHYPVASKTPAKDLEALVQEGVKRRFPDGFPDEKVYNERLKKELHTIETMGYDNYFLVVREFLNYGELLGKVPKERIPESPVDIDELKKWIADNGWQDNAGYRIGTGRGSDGGSLTCYLLGITNLDPIKHDLLFERFLNIERISMPDIDSDISADTRQKLIDHVKYIYGEPAVCGIMTSNFFSPKSAINNAAKYYGLAVGKEGAFYQTGLKLAAMVPDVPETFFDMTVDPVTGDPSDSEEAVKLSEYMRPAVAGDKDKETILLWAQYLDGVFSSYGAHAAGIVIMEKGADVSDVLPLRFNTKLGMMTTQCSKEDVEANGLLKFDFLGLKTLDIITETLFMIQERTGKGIDVLKLDTADKNVYEKIFASGNTDAVFQFESEGMKKMLKAFHPSTFDDLVLLVAAYRPGPMQFLSDIIEVKNGRKEASYLTPELKPLLGNTYGAIIYQEQVMQICQNLAGYSLGQADLVRKAMSKKNKKKLAHEEESFIYGDKERNIVGCVGNGIKEETAKEIFAEMMDFASYAFNKSHAAAYAYNSYITAWLKCYYPAEFLAAAMNWSDNDKHPLSGLIKEARACGITVLPPDINCSDKYFAVEDGKIRFALSKIRKVKNSADAVIAERKAEGPYRTFSDFLARAGVGSAVSEALVLSGAFDFTGKSRQGLVSAMNELKPLAKTLSDKIKTEKACEVLLENFHDGMTDEEAEKVLTGAGIKPVPKLTLTAEALENTCDRAVTAIQDLKKQMNGIEQSVTTDEDLTERLDTEKTYLSSYISAGPLSGYPSAEEMNLAPVSEACEDTAKVFGYIEDVRITKRRSDGRPMVFFTITDDRGSVPAVCFADRYSYLKDKLTDGAVSVFSGKMLTDKEGLRFSVDSLETPKRSGGMILVGVKDLRIFHLYDEKDFREKYEDEDGLTLLYHDGMTGLIRKAGYRVSEEALKSGLPVRKI